MYVCMYEGSVMTYEGKNYMVRLLNSKSEVDSPRVCLEPFLA